MRYIVIGMALAGLSTAAVAEPIEYTFTLENVEQAFYRNPDVFPPAGEPFELIEIPLTTPAYPADVPISGSFSYDPSIQGIMSNADNVKDPGAALYRAAFANVDININGDVHTNPELFAVFIDETSSNPTDGFVPQDVLFTLQIFAPDATTRISIDVDGVTLTSVRPSLSFPEGNETGFNFFPDSAMNDDPSEFYSSASLPPYLPPKGASVQRLSFRFEEDIDNDFPAEKAYIISGDLVLSPAPPEPPPVPRDYVFTIEVTEQSLSEEGVPLPLESPFFDNTTEITGGFRYDPTLPYPSVYSSFLCSDTSTCIGGSGPGGEIADLRVTMLGQTFGGKTNDLIQIFDETHIDDPGGGPDGYSGGYWGAEDVSGPQDVLGIGTLPFGDATQAIQFEHDGIVYESTGLHLAMWEGDEGYDFFPEPPEPQGFPAELPPAGATYLLGVVNFRSVNEVSPGVYRSYSVKGPLILKDAPIDIAIDVDPFSPDNVVFPNSDNPIAVSIISSSTVNGEAVDFDTGKIDPATLKFGSDDAPNVALPMPFDFSDDNNTDLAVVFKTQDAGILCNDTEVELTGETYSGQLFRGTDTIDASDCVDGSCHPL